jgi:hypothetical protein
VKALGSGLACVCAMSLAMGMVATGAVQAQAVGGISAANVAEGIDWRRVQPVASLVVRRLPLAEAPVQYRARRGLFVLEGTVTDARSGRTLMNPRLIVTPGVATSVEIGSQDELLLRLTVRVASRDEVSATSELRRGGDLVSSSTTRFALKRL